MSNIATRPQARGTFGVATSTRRIASAGGLDILVRGGSAFDAGVAMGFIPQIVVHHLSGPGRTIIEPAMGQETIAAHGARGRHTAPHAGLRGGAAP